MIGSAAIIPSLIDKLYDPDNGLRLDWETFYECNVLF
jgi:hypothetical protein